MSTALRAASGSSAENLFISLFEDVFGAEKTGYLYSQYPFFDIYQDSRFADFLLENGGRRVAIEIDDDASHLPGHVSQVKHYDDLTKQNSMVHMGWAVYRWPVRIMQEQPERVKDELRIFLGSQPQFRAIADYLPTQHGRTFQLKEHQQEALDALAKMREAKETIALIHHATRCAPPMPRPSRPPARPRGRCGRRGTSSPSGSRCPRRAPAAFADTAS